MFAEFQLRRNYYLIVLRIELLSEEDNTLTLGNVFGVHEWNVEIAVEYISVRIRS